MSTATSTASTATPFTVAIDPKEVEELNRRLDTARWPLAEVVPILEGQEEVGSFGMGYGPTLPLMKEIAKEWRNDYSWSKTESYINTFNHFKQTVEGLSIHYIHHTSPSPHAIPILIAHGWPGSFLEFLPVIHALTNPAEGEQAFHVVVPSMPGFAFSDPPPSHLWVMDDTARVMNSLMKSLGYSAYAAQGGDWGSILARCLGSLYPENCKAVHLNFCPATGGGILDLIPTRTLVTYLPRFLISDIERERAFKALHYVEKGSAYYAMQQHTPRTPAYALNDSPVGLLAWIVEKMEPTVERCKTERPNPTMTRQEIFATCSLYWFTHSIGTSFLPYALNPHFSTYLSSPKYHLPSFALSVFPNEIAIVPEKFVRKTGNLKWVKEAETGGHFASLEEPEAFVQHVREAMGLLWDH